MVAYRLYFVDGDGRIARGEWIDVESDDDAIENARLRKHPHRIEIWRRMEHMTTVEPEGSA